MQMKQLEEQIGLPLLEQIGKRLFLTEAGHELRMHAQRIALQTQELKTAMDQFRDLQRGFLRLAVVSTANYFLPPLIATLSERHPGHAHRAAGRSPNREDVLTALADNPHRSCDPRGSRPRARDLIALPFKDNPLVVIAAPTHPLTKLTPDRAEKAGPRDVRRARTGFRDACRHRTAVRGDGDRLFAGLRIQHE